VGDSDALSGTDRHTIRRKRVWLEEKLVLLINVKFGPRFREVFGAEEKRIKLPKGAVVRSLLDRICDSDARRIKLFGSTDKLRPSVAVTKNGRFIIHLRWLDTELADGDNVEIISFVSGG
jgi:thiamine biosynthesis protein ThiS